MASMKQLVRWGFRRWYERQLIESHAWLVSAFLCLIVAIAGVEVAGNEHGIGRVGGWLLMGLAALGVAVCFQRYRAMLELAERLGETAVCPACGRYARFEIEAASGKGGSEGEPQRISARCRHCEKRWQMPR